MPSPASAPSTAFDPATPLLGFLIEQLSAERVSYAAPPQQLLGGNETTTFAFHLRDAPDDDWNRPLILRLFNLRPPSDAQFTREPLIQNALANSGAPVPRVLLTHRDPAVLGAPFFIMERVPGSTMIPHIRPSTVVVDLPNLLFAVPRRLADLQAMLLRIDTDPVRSAAEAAGLSPVAITCEHWLESIQRNIDAHTLSGYSAGLAWAREHTPPVARCTSLCHCDFHPLNILQDHGRTTGIIDWPKACLAEPEFDVGNTRIILTCTNVSLPPPFDIVGRAIQRAIMRRYSRRIHDLLHLDSERVAYGEAVRCLSELCAIDAVAARRLEGTYVLEGTAPAAWDTGRLIARFTAITGVPLTPHYLT